LELDGIVGYEIFNLFVVEIAYATGLITLHDRATFKYRGAGSVVPIDLEDNRWYATATVLLDSGEPFSGKFLVDTGAGQIAAALTRPFVDGHGLLRLSASSVRSRVHHALGGVTRSFVKNARVFRIGAARMTNVAVDLSRDATGLLASSHYDGVIGGYLLREFTIIFDPFRHQMVFESNHGA
jgi:hypothetical protein